MRHIDTIVDHYSATAPEDDVSMARIRGWHLDRGFSDIGYHFGIDRDGIIHEGRPIERKGAGVKNRNAGKIHVVWFGGVEASDRNKGVDNRTGAQKATQRRFYTELIEKYGLDPETAVQGHRDVADPRYPTQCPGYDANAWWRHQMQTAPDPAAPVHSDDMGEDDLTRPVVDGAPSGGFGAAVTGIAISAGLPWWAGVLIGAAVTFAMMMMIRRARKKEA